MLERYENSKEKKDAQFELEEKTLGPTIGGGNQQDATRDHDGDGVINDGTQDEKPAPKKGPSKKPPVVRRIDGKWKPKPAPSLPYKPGYILPDEGGNWQDYDGTPPKDKPHFREHRDGSIYEIRPNRPPKKVGYGPNETI
jgi:hypothetical protein